MTTTEASTPLSSWTFDKPCETMQINDLNCAKLTFVPSKESIDNSDLIVLGVISPSTDDKDNEKKESETTEPPVLTGEHLNNFDTQFQGAIKDLMMEQAESFKNGAEFGSATSTLRLVVPDAKDSSSFSSKRFILVGLGTSEEISKKTSDLFTKIGQTIATKCHDEKATNCTVILPVLPTTTSDNAPHFSKLSTEFYSSLYADNRYRTGKNIQIKSKTLLSVSILNEGASASDEKSVNEAIETGKVIAKGISMAKDVVNAPHNILNSVSLANVARKIAEDSDGGCIKCRILEKEDCEERNMGAYLGVARGSETPPQFIHMTYTPEDGEVKKKVGIVGKGLLFDTGGYNIKVAMMELMKFDCGGAAAVLGAAEAIGQLKPKGVEVHFIIAACENMINDRAMVPSDVLTASNGKTIEVLNTDAEGRLTMADALVYADEEVGCESIIELSTLTGACMISLGKKICGVWTNDDDLAKELECASKVTGDKSWRMPMETEYNEQLKSKIADLSNCGTRYGGAITAALFLQNFVSDKKPFAHIDIAGPVWSDKDGATGFGSKLVTEWVLQQGKE